MKKVFLFVAVLLISCSNKSAQKGPNYNLQMMSSSVFDITSARLKSNNSQAVIIHLKKKQKLLGWSVTNDRRVYLELLEDSTDTQTITLLEE